MAKKSFPYKTQNGGEISEGVWVDKFGDLVHVRPMPSNPKYDWEYNGSISFNISSYYGLRSYSQNLVCKLKDTRQAAAFLEKLAQPQPSRTPKKGIVSRVIRDIKETVQLVKNDRCPEPLL